MRASWNWKTALFSGVYRASGFIVSSWQFGPVEAARAGALEFVLFSTLAGFTGAAIQRVRNVKPAWVAGTVALVAIPGLLHASEWLVHGRFHSAARERGVALSIGMTALAELFSLYVMREGAMLTGEEGRSLAEDVTRIPALVAGFLLWITGRGGAGGPERDVSPRGGRPTGGPCRAGRRPGRC